MVMRQRSLKNIYTQQALLAVLPRLAAFNPTIFTTKSVSFISPCSCVVCCHVFQNAFFACDEISFCAI